MAVSELPVRRYLLTPLVVSLVFMAVAGYQERQNLLPSLGLVDPPAASLRDVAPARDAVRATNSAIAGAYASGSPAALLAAPLTPALRAALASELLDPVAARAASGLSLVQMEFLVPAAGSAGNSVTTDETWVALDGRRHRLRFTYRLDEALRVVEVTPVLPEAVRDADR